MLDLPTGPEAPRSARRWLAGLAARCGAAPGLVDDAVLVLSELVTNVVDHTDTHPAIRLQAVCTERRIWVAVLDHSRGEPVLREPDANELRGRGMRLVEAVTSRWGTVPESNGKRVWFELAVP